MISCMRPLDPKYVPTEGDDQIMNPKQNEKNISKSLKRLRKDPQQMPVNRYNHLVMPPNDQLLNLENT